jgi:hypothetical protein
MTRRSAAPSVSRSRETVLFNPSSGHRPWATFRAWTPQGDGLAEHSSTDFSPTQFDIGFSNDWHSSVSRR